MVYVLKSYFRKFKRYISDYKLLFLISIIAMIYILLNINWVLESMKNYKKFILLGIYLYSIAKLLQENPIIIIKPELIELKILSLTKLKLLIFLKSIIPSTLLLICILMSKIPLTKEIFIVYIINFTVNISSFIASQVKHKLAFKILLVIMLSISYMLSSMIVAFIILISVIGYLFFIKSLNHEKFLPYYKAILKISNSFFEKNTKKTSFMSEEKNIIVSNNTKTLNILLKNYSSNRVFFFMKEISRIYYIRNNVLNAIIIGFLISLVSKFYVKKEIIIILSFILLTNIIENILSNLNMSESKLKKEGFYLPFTLKENLKYKLLPQIMMVFIILLSGIFLLNKSRIAMYFILSILLPVKNIINAFGEENKKKKILIYGMNFIIYSTIYIFLK